MTLIRRMICLFGLVLPMALMAQPKQKIIGDYSVTEYLDGLGYVSDIEWFTKQPDRKAYFGMTCSSMSALPMVQIIVFDEELMAETPKLVSVEYALGQMTGKVIFNGVLKVMDTVDELSNQVVLDPDKQHITSLLQIKQAYQNLFAELSHHAGKPLMITVRHKSFPDKSFQFSTQGLGQLLKQYEKVCF